MSYFSQAINKINGRQWAGIGLGAAGFVTASGVMGLATSNDRSYGRRFAKGVGVGLATPIMAGIGAGIVGKGLGLIHPTAGGIAGAAAGIGIGLAAPGLMLSNDRRKSMRVLKGWGGAAVGAAAALPFSLASHALMG